MPDITDNDLTVNPGTGGASIATDYDGTRHFQVTKIAYGNSASTQRVDSTHPLPTVLAASDGTALSVTSGKLDVNVEAASALDINIQAVTTGTYVPIIGVSGGTAVGITANDFDIRGLSAGNFGGTAPGDSVSVMGMSGGFPVGVTANDFDIRGLTAGNPYTGTGPADSVSVVGISGGYPVPTRLNAGSGVTTAAVGVSGTSLLTFVSGGTVNIGNTVGVTANDFDIRALSMGTPADGVPAGYDGVRVTGYSGGYPVASLVYGVSGGTLLGIGVASGDRLKVDIGGTTFSGTVNLSSLVGISGPVDVRGSTTATAPVWVAGGTAAGRPIGVCGAGTNSSVPIEGTTNGVLVGVTFATVNIRGLTGTDFVGITGAAYTALQHLAAQVYAPTYASIPALQTTGNNHLGNISTKASSGSTTAPGILEAILSALKLSSYSATSNAVRSEVINSSNINVSVQDVVQPSGVTNGSLSVTVAGESFPSYTCKSGVMCKAAAGNTDTVYVGKAASGLTASGFPLEPGESVYVEVSNLNLLGGAADTGTQSIRYLAS